jgi:hypothetical protein
MADCLLIVMVAFIQTLDNSNKVQYVFPYHSNHYLMPPSICVRVVVSIGENYLNGGGGRKRIIARLNDYSR